MNTPEDIKARVSKAAESLKLASQEFVQAMQADDRVGASSASNRGMDALNILLEVRKAEDQEPSWIHPDFKNFHVGSLEENGKSKPLTVRQALNKVYHAKHPDGGQRAGDASFEYVPEHVIVLKGDWKGDPWKARIVVKELADACSRVPWT